MFVKRILHWWHSKYHVAIRTRESPVQFLIARLGNGQKSIAYFVFVLTKWSHVRSEFWVNFQNESISRMQVRFLYNVEARTKYLMLLTYCRCQLSYQCSTFTVWHLDCLCVNIYLIFNPWWMFSPCEGWCVPTKRVLQGSGRGQKPYSESEFVFFRIHVNKKKSNFDSWCKPGVYSSWMEFDFVLLSKILDRLKRLFLVQIPRVTVYREMRNIYV